MAFKNPVVSVVIPAYNYAEFLPVCLSGVCRQTVRELEIIVVDDGSTDGTEAVVRGFPDERIRYVRMPHQGNYFARNRGIKESRGEFIAFLDADDVWIAPDKLREQLEVFRRKPGIGLCFSNEYVYEESSGRVLTNERGMSGSADDQGKIWGVLSRCWCINSSSVIVRRACLDAVGVFDTMHHNAMDVDLWSRILFRCDGFYDDRRLVVRRRHGRNHSLNPKAEPAVDYAFTKLLADECALRRLTEEQKADFLLQKELIIARLRTRRPRKRSVLTALFRPPWHAFPFRIVRYAKDRLRWLMKSQRFRREIRAVLGVLSDLKKDYHPTGTEPGGSPDE